MPHCRPWIVPFALALVIPSLGRAEQATTDTPAPKPDHKATAPAATAAVAKETKAEKPHLSVSPRYDLAKKRVAAGAPYTIILQQPPKATGEQPTVTILVDEEHQRFDIRRALTAARTDGSDRATSSDPETLDESSSAEPHQSLLDFALGPSVMTRNFRYSTSPANSSQLRDYHLPGMVLIEGRIDVYPAMGVALPVLPDIGISASYGHSLDMPSITSDARQFETHSHRWQTGLRFRKMLGTRLRLHGDLQYGQQQFQFRAINHSAELIRDQVPNVHYEHLRFHAEGGYLVKQVGLWLGLGYLGMLSGGETYARFRSPELHGLDLDGRCELALSHGFGLRLRGEYRRIFSSFAPQPGDSYIAGGALEQMLTAHLGVRYVH